MNPHRRRASAALLVLAAAGLPRWAAAAAPRIVEVWKAAGCGCCEEWLAHLSRHGFTTRTHDTGNNAVRARLGMPAKYGSCHTARIGGYVLEGHVPAREVLRLLKEQPRAVGLAVPGMPLGSPGMDGPVYEGKTQPFDVLLVRHDGTTRVYQSYGT